jgi:tetratricopeptide (TPR) repeat protein
MRRITPSPLLALLLLLLLPALASSPAPPPPRTKRVPLLPDGLPPRIALAAVAPGLFDAAGVVLDARIAALLEAAERAKRAGLRRAMVDLCAGLFDGDHLRAAELACQRAVNLAPPTTPARSRRQSPSAAASASASASASAPMSSAMSPERRLTADALFYRARVAGGLGENGRAVAFLEDALAANPFDSDVHYLLGFVLHTQYDRDVLPRALRHYKRAGEIRPTHASAHYNLALVRRKR